MLMLAIAPMILLYEAHLMFPLLDRYEANKMLPVRLQGCCFMVKCLLVKHNTD